MVSKPFSSLDDKFRSGVYQILARHESRFDLINNKINQILTEIQALRMQMQQTQPTLKINPFPAPTEAPHISLPTQSTFPTPAKASPIPPPPSMHIATISLPTPPMLTTIDTTLPPKRAQFHPIPPPIQISTTTHITPHHMIYDQKNIKKIVNKIVQLHVLQVSVRDLDRFRNWNLPTPTRTAASAAFNLHHTVHYISSTTVMKAVFPLPVFDPGGYGSIEEVGAIVAIWVAFLFDVSKFRP